MESKFMDDNTRLREEISRLRDEIGRLETANKESRMKTRDQVRRTKKYFLTKSWKTDLINYHISNDIFTWFTTVILNRDVMIVGSFLYASTLVSPYLDTSG